MILLDFYKENPTDRIWWVDAYDLEQERVSKEDILSGKVVVPIEYADNILMGTLMISFDKWKTYDLWVDYPYNMTTEEVELFDKENPYWADFFKDRKSGK